MIKQQLRKIYKQKRAELPSAEKLKLDDLMLIKFQQLFFEDVQMLFTYWPMANYAEPNTLLFSSYLRHMIPGLQIAYPVCDFLTAGMQAVLINEETVYHTNTLGITQPKEGEIAAPELIDLVFVPMLACNNEGYRVGYGKGFYDHYLAQCREGVLKIGFSYFEPVAHIDDIDPFDIPLNFCITPEAVYEF